MYYLKEIRGHALLVSAFVFVCGLSVKWAMGICSNGYTPSTKMAAMGSYFLKMYLMTSG